MLELFRNLVPSEVIDFILIFFEDFPRKARLNIFLVSKENSLLFPFGINGWWENRFIGTQIIVILEFPIVGSCIAIGQLRSYNILDGCCFVWVICITPLRVARS